MFCLLEMINGKEDCCGWHQQIEDAPVCLGLEASNDKPHVGYEQENLNDDEQDECFVDGGAAELNRCLRRHEWRLEEQRHNSPTNQSANREANCVCNY